MKDITKEHYQKHTISEVLHIPDHTERSETDTFKKSKQLLEPLGCFICGTNEKNESHHIFERSFWNALNLERVAYLLFHHFDFHGYCKKSFKNEYELYQHLRSYKDDEGSDSIFNLMVLCGEHHRGEGNSAHGSTFATFIAWMARKDGYEISMSNEEYEDLKRK